MSNTFTKIGDQWIVRTQAEYAPGSTVTVTKRNGATSSVILGARVRGPVAGFFYAVGQRPAQPTQAVGDLTRILALFATAQAAQPRRRKPVAIVFADFRINVAGARARQPGSLTITHPTQNDHAGKRRWLGRITLAGTFEPSRDADATLGDKLRAFACDPAGFAGQHGRVTHNSCFCNLALTDERSQLVGYGPICADNFNLPWGARPARTSAEWRADHGIASNPEAEMQRMEAEGDREQTARDEAAKHEARAEMEREDNADRRLDWDDLAHSGTF